MAGLWFVCKFSNLYNIKTRAAVMQSLYFHNKSVAQFGTEHRTQHKAHSTDKTTHVTHHTTHTTQHTTHNNIPNTQHTRMTCINEIHMTKFHMNGLVLDVSAENIACNPFITAILAQWMQ